MTLITCIRFLGNLEQGETDYDTDSIDIWMYHTGRLPYCICQSWCWWAGNRRTQHVQAGLDPRLSHYWDTFCWWDVWLTLHDCMMTEKLSCDRCPFQLAWEESMLCIVVKQNEWVAHYSMARACLATLSAVIKFPWQLQAPLLPESCSAVLSWTAHIIYVDLVQLGRQDGITGYFDVSIKTDTQRQQLNILDDGQVASQLLEISLFPTRWNSPKVDTQLIQLLKQKRDLAHTKYWRKSVFLRAQKNCGAP